MKEIIVYKAKTPRSLIINRNEIYFYQEVLEDGSKSKVKEPFSKIELSETNSRTGRDFIIKHCSDLFKINVSRVNDLKEFVNYLTNNPYKEDIKNYFTSLDIIRKKRERLYAAAEEAEEVKRINEDNERNELTSKIYKLLDE